ncbi:hypothetical protein NBRC111894_2084 [Sporolactobacillus inulinus]|uniref:Uncharacterized protein n=1 Tax=Sporolactobacillus inulinus TaxID=2078 RepID=A0A4Y1ZBZ6_9BACL|nr:hypothetical protein NBRC111894_2084 [Sporolactobacillus inulinus]
MFILQFNENQNEFVCYFLFERLLCINGSNAIGFRPTLLLIQVFSKR